MLFPYLSIYYRNGIEVEAGDFTAAGAVYIPNPYISRLIDADFGQVEGVTAGFIDVERADVVIRVRIYRMPSRAAGVRVGVRLTVEFREVHAVVAYADSRKFGEGGLGISSDEKRVFEDDEVLAVPVDGRTVAEVEDDLALLAEAEDVETSGARALAVGWSEDYVRQAVLAEAGAVAKAY